MALKKRHGVRTIRKFGKRGRNTDINAVLRPNATIEVTIGQSYLFMPFLKTRKLEKSGNFACKEETFLSRVSITSFVSQSISFPPTSKIALQAIEGS